LVRATISGFAFTLRLPDIVAATITEVPDDRWRGWQWSSKEFILLHLDPAQEFAIGPPTETRRESLLAALATLERVSE
jgi:hypothetical protein